MKNIYLICSNKVFYQNNIFKLDNPDNRDNCLYPYYLLKQELAIKGIQLNTYDYLKDGAKENYALLFFDFPKNIDYYLQKHQGKDMYLLVYESPIKNPANQDRNNHSLFKKIFTWDEQLVDNKKYFKVNYAQLIPEKINYDISKKEKLCSAIFSHKMQSHPKELYSERMKAIRWFEALHPEDFDLYGAGWDRYYFKNKFFHLNRLKFITKLLKPNFPSYRGLAEEKKQTYGKYRFAVCYENSAFSNYITEKIFDCFFGGCVPIYLGAGNISEHIPAGTFVDKRNFDTYEDLYAYIKNMPDSEYEAYMQEIKKFLGSEKMHPFTAEYFAHTISEELAKGA
ncbi:MAG: hypothetical protein EXS48_00590 [Candidatus Staskawiczbacteria bacterium]|nr:hypothetical protein [Candidatus Staskawiczbacteria bacterium]